MKKILLTLAVALILVGCTDARAKIKSSNPLLKVGKTTITGKDLYPYLVENFGVDTVTTIVNRYLYEHVVTEKEDFTPKIEEMIEALKAIAGDSYYAMYGLSSESAFISTMLQEYQLEAVAKVYIADHYDDLCKDYLPAKLAILQFADQKAATDALAEAKKGVALTDLAETYGAKTDKYDGSESIYSISSGLSSEVSSYALYATQPSIVDSPIAATDSYFYIVQVISVDRSALKEEISDAFLMDESVYQEAILFYCREYKLTYYDKAILNLIYSNNPEYLP